MSEEVDDDGSFVPDGELSELGLALRFVGVGVLVVGEGHEVLTLASCTFLLSFHLEVAVEAHELVGRPGCVGALAAHRDAAVVLPLPHVPRVPHLLDGDVLVLLYLFGLVSRAVLG